jgi:single-strand DNA-binding protein
MDTFLWMQGNLVADPVQRVTASGLKVTKFRIASSGRRFDNASGGWVDTEVVYMSVNCWKQLGLNVLQSLHKGDTVVVGGRLRFREYDAPEGGGRRQAYEMEASSVGPDLSRYVGTFGKPMRELPDADTPAVPAQQASPVDDPWAAPVGAVAEETAA